MEPKFKRHFRVYLVNNHPSYIVDEEGKEYVFHRMTKSKTFGGKNNWKIEPNPIKDCYFTCYMIKKEEIANKRKFSKEKLKIKKGIDSAFPWIKRAKKK